ncbi:MAG: sugar kinase, partial [Deltaproteobacteria bacterium]|nr:sugar kinase [Deltaproteobacteria bacterium]
WEGRYGWDFSNAETIATHLNVLSRFDPVIPREYRKSEYVFLANIDPELQLKVLEQVENPKLVACDTMNFWIEGKQDKLRELLKKVDMFVINEGEAREFSDEASLVRAARHILDCGPHTVIIKRGEYGALMFKDDEVFNAPAYPMEDIFDPTGAGDSFAGGLMGYLANTGDLSEEGLRKAIIIGSTMASFNVEAFSLNRLKDLTLDEINLRYKAFKRLTHFEEL